MFVSVDKTQKPQLCHDARRQRGRRDRVQHPREELPARADRDSCRAGNSTLRLVVQKNAYRAGSHHQDQQNLEHGNARGAPPAMTCASNRQQA